MNETIKNGEFEEIETRSTLERIAGKYIWNEIPVLITFESDWKEAKSILNKNTFKDQPTQLNDPIRPARIEIR